MACAFSLSTQEAEAVSLFVSFFSLVYLAHSNSARHSEILTDPTPAKDYVGSSENLVTSSQAVNVAKL